MAEARKSRPAKAAEPQDAPEITMQDLVEENKNDALEQQNALLRAQIEQQSAMLAALQAQMAQSAEEKIHFLWMAEVADENVVTFGENGSFGRVVGKLGQFSIPKSSLHLMMDNAVRYYLDRRWLLVLSGMDKEDREMLGCNYSDDELLDRRAFARLAEIGDEVLQIYPKLCTGHKELVEKRLYEDSLKVTSKMTRDRAEKLLALAQEAGLKGEGFREIIRAMNHAQER